jgi:ABC-type lipoprotein export system ATPase subunit
MNGNGEPVLTMVNVTATLGDERFTDVEKITFDISPGECLSIALQDHRDSPLPGFALGERISESAVNRSSNYEPSAAAKSQSFLSTEAVDVAMSGRVLFEGVSWEYRSTYGLLACRGRIGWVLSQPAWVNNLNVLENVLLRQMHHTTVPRKDLLAQAQELAYAVDLPEVPAGRMGAMEISKLRRAEWVRAFLGNPRLVILQRAFNGIEHTHRDALTQIVRAALKKGTAVLWLAGVRDELVAANGLACRQFAMDGPKMKRVEVNQ